MADQLGFLTSERCENSARALVERSQYARRPEFSQFTRRATVNGGPPRSALLGRSAARRRLEYAVFMTLTNAERLRRLERYHAVGMIPRKRPHSRAEVEEEMEAVMDQPCSGEDREVLLRSLPVSPSQFQSLRGPNARILSTCSPRFTMRPRLSHLILGSPSQAQALVKRPELTFGVPFPQGGQTEGPTAMSSMMVRNEWSDSMGVARCQTVRTYRLYI